MGQEISCSNFSSSDFDSFQSKLENQTAKLEEWFKDKIFKSNNLVCGYELEAWLTDTSASPAAKNDIFLEKIQNKLVVPELSKFNFELNSNPIPIQSDTLKQLFEELNYNWNNCEEKANQLNLKAMMIGTLPTITDDLLTLDNMSSSERYKALNHELLKLKQGNPIVVDIENNDHLFMEHADIMMEAATTSLQIHLQVPQEDSVRYFNASQIISPINVALCANSPFLYGLELWDETRIPLFEQAVYVKSFSCKEKRKVKRVTFGARYIEESLFEIFKENLDTYPVLLPIDKKLNENKLDHLRMHNGTIWRWNRPLIGFGDNIQPSLRIEHRVIPSGPSVPDVIANIAFYLGITHYFAKLSENSPESQIEFNTIKANFYNSAKYGLNAKIYWLDGKLHDIQKLLLNELIGLCKVGLKDLGINEEHIKIYIDDIITQRTKRLLNGAEWQKNYVKKNGKDLQKMTMKYYENQKTNTPVHEWQI